ncbi:ABC transporter permease [Paralcaligenes ureilyticus]|uniref:Peptide/nickel transport system permease protein n=1 Tax=Paralcaligenes ureilyticus TaxID=627131 RepID=A0A4R3MCL4_9BURK|nr:ABC transporter permease [Paralcaligenes ureilyticus]TCT09757.1 peptide/nickel transport system permease protein [Paralcaligenes ureilyticus]
MNSLSFMSRRVMSGIVMIIAVVVLNFLLLSAAPGDIADVLAVQAGGSTTEQTAAIRKELGLDKSLFAQLSTYVVNVAKGNLGQSLFYNDSVAHLIEQRLPNTLILVLPAMFIAVVLGTLLGVLSAHKPGGPLNFGVTFLSLAGFAAPVFWSGMVLLIIFAYWFPIFPASGMYNIGGEPTGLDAVWQVSHHLVLPVISLSMVYLAQYSRQARATMLDVLGSDYIRTARAKGLRERAVIYKHALKNAVLPVVTLAGLQFSQAIAGAVLVETVFNWPGLGRLAFDAVLNRDFPLMLGILLISAVLVVVVNIFVDWFYSILDPRIKLEG